MSSFSRHYLQGQSFQQFVAQGEVEEITAVATVGNKLQAVNTVPLKLVKKIQAIDYKVNMLVIGDMFCPDCHVNISAFNYIAQRQTNINMAIISREYAQQYLLVKLGLTEIKIPLLLVLDENMQLLHPQTDKNLFIERPKTVLGIANFDEIKTSYLAGDYLANTIAEVLAMIAKLK